MLHTLRCRMSALLAYVSGVSLQMDMVEHIYQVSVPASTVIVLQRTGDVSCSCNTRAIGGVCASLLCVDAKKQPRVTQHQLCYSQTCIARLQSKRMCC